MTGKKYVHVHAQHSTVHIQYNNSRVLVISYIGAVVKYRIYEEKTWLKSAE